MNTNNILKCVITLAWLGLVVAGCKSDSKNAMPTNDASVSDAGTPTAGSGGSGGSGGTAGGTSGTGGSGGSGGTGGDLDATVPDDTGTTPPPPQCTDSTNNDCWKASAAMCAPTTDPEFLNTCITGFTCNHYDNTPLGLTNGVLPAL